MKKRTVDVQSLACASCDVQVLDMRSDEVAQARAKHVGVKRVPAAAVNGKVLGGRRGR